MTSESTRFLGQPNEIKPTEGAVGAVGLVTSTIVPPPAVGQRLAGGSHGVLLWKPLESHPFHDETAGVDDEDVGIVDVSGEARAGAIEQAHHDLGIDEVFGAA